MIKKRSLGGCRLANMRYLMESSEEELRLELKTDPEAVLEQARWCGVTKGKKILDAGCGPGIVTSLLSNITEHPIVGVDYSPKRIAYARKHYGKEDLIEFALYDLRDELPFGERFDLVWARFVLEYNRSSLNQIVENLTKVLRPGGTLCLLDLDNNCLGHYPLPARLENALHKIMGYLEEEHDFDPYVGRKLYSLIYEAGFEEIRMDMRPHHLIYGDVSRGDMFNWTKKVEMVTQKAPFVIKEIYPNGLQEFFGDFEKFFENPMRFTYTPIIMCKGIKPLRS